MNEPFVSPFSGEPPTDAAAADPARLPALVATAPLGIVECRLEPGTAADDDGLLRVVSANPAAEAMLGVSGADRVGLALEQALPVLAATDLPRAFRQVALTGEPAERTHLRQRNGRLLSAWRFVAWRTAADCIAIAFWDVTAQSAEDIARQALQASEQELQQANDQLQLQIALYQVMEGVARVGHWVRLDGANTTRWSRGLFDIAGLPPKAEMTYVEGRSGIVEEDRAGFVAARERLDTDVMHYRWRRPDGDIRWLRSRVRRSAPGDALQAEFGVVLDITEERVARAALEEKLAFIQNIATHVPGFLFQFRRHPDGTSSVPYVSDAVERMMGMSAQTLMRGERSMLEHIVPEDVDRVVTSSMQAVEANAPWQCEYRVRLPDGRVRWHFANAAMQHDADGSVLQHGFTMDVTERKESEAQIERLAFYDALTGLPNRRLFNDRLVQATERSARTGEPGALLFIDLDNFKDLNDTLGHDMGDRLLQQVAERLAGAVRSSDTVSRFGGDEFVVMLQELNALQLVAISQVEAVAGKLMAALNQPFDLGDGQQQFSTPSVGVTLFHGSRVPVDELLKHADLAMYQAKAAGRNTMRFFDPEMQTAVSARSALESDLRHSLAADQLRLYYQPVVDAAGRLSGAEALLRWLHPQRGMVSPGDFIPLAEQTGLILPIGLWVLETACAQLVAWSQDAETAALTLAVNVSARQFRHPEFVPELQQLLERTGARPALLKLELTESLLLQDVEDIIAKMNALKAAGVGFSLDDFGTGYSSLSYLKRLPLDQLKIDQSFVADVLTDPNDAAIVRTILALAHSLDLEVVAEGVETAGQLEFLVANGCKAFQGYFFARPAPVAAIAGYMAPPGFSGRARRGL